MAWNVTSSWFNSARPRIKMFIFFTSQRLLAVPEAHICILLSFCVSFLSWEQRKYCWYLRSCTSEVCWLITTLSCEGHWVLIFVTNQTLHIYCPLVKAKQGCGSAPSFVSGWCPQCSAGVRCFCQPSSPRLTNQLTPHKLESVGWKCRRKAAQGKRDCQLKPEVTIMCFPLDSLNSFHSFLLTQLFGC